MTDIAQTRIEKFEPFEDAGEVKISYIPHFSKYAIARRIPDGMIERGRNQNLEAQDIGFLEWCVENYSDWDFWMLVNDDPEKACYVIDLIISVVMDNEITQWDEFGDEEFNFTENGSLGVQ